MDRRLSTASQGHPRPRVINVDGNPSYPKAIAELKKTGELGRRCRCRPIRYLNNIVEQDHRAIKRIVKPMMGFKDFHCARIILAGIEVMHMIRKGQMRGDGIAQNPAEQFYSIMM